MGGVRGVVGGGARKRRNLSAVKIRNSRRTKKSSNTFFIDLYRLNKSTRRLINYMIPNKNY